MKSKGRAAGRGTVWESFTVVWSKSGQAVAREWLTSLLLLFQEDMLMDEQYEKVHICMYIQILSQ
jgi:hypothetical protein